MDGFNLGMDVGEAAERRRHEERDDWLRRLSEACQAAQNGDPEPLRELGRQSAGDDLLDLADEAGATPLPVADGEQLVDEVEQWLWEQGK